MFDSMYFYLMVVVVVFALGDLIAHFTKGRLSGMMMVMLIFLVASSLLLFVAAPVIGLDTVLIGMPVING
ncbi:MAG: hypothetical protein LUH19_09185, partial [Lachnospiraceae bacterium]|nr:hypothetical protein [Lachnospiraceae bacterium]